MVMDRGRDAPLFFCQHGEIFTAMKPGLRAIETLMIGNGMVIVASSDFHNT